MGKLLEVVDKDYFDFVSSASHPHEGEKLHPILMVFKLLYCLDLGFLPLSHLCNTGSNLLDIFSPPMIATAYFIILCYFLTNGKDVPNGAQSKYVIMLSLCCH